MSVALDESPIPRYVIFRSMAHHLPSIETSRDPLKRMRVFQLGEELRPDAWSDARALTLEPLMEGTAKQLYAAVCSIAANISEGYSRSSGKDRAKIFEYALGSTREAMSWYRAAEPILDRDLISDRLGRLEEIRRMLLAIIPRERGTVMKKFNPPGSA